MNRKLSVIINAGNHVFKLSPGRLAIGLGIGFQRFIAMRIVAVIKVRLVVESRLVNR